ncbi:MAG: AraC family transcriptional regulator [Verrucomicrobiaceae bacterium]|nr:AraC family transcriptional regulator [Verrucomicrobiaceae bacterium]
MPSHLHLADPASLRFDWLWVYDGLVPTADIWSKEIVVPPGVFFVLSGLGKIQADGHEFKLPPGSAFFSAPGIRRQWFASGTRLLSVGYRALWPDSAALFTGGLNCKLLSTSLRPLHIATRQLYRGIHGKRRSVSYRDATASATSDFVGWSHREAAFRTWFAVYVKTLEKLGFEPAPRHRPSDERINEIIRRLNDWPLARPLSVDELASDLPIGSRTLEQLLAQEMALTPHAHLNRRRIEAARHLLATTATPLKQIAHELGLLHASHFTKWFRRHAGVAPSVYREGGITEAV